MQHPRMRSFEKAICGFSAILVYSFAFLCLYDSRLSNAADTLTAGEVLRDWHVLESPNKIFQLGFFNPGLSSSRYLAIRSTDGFLENKMVWVANRDNPLNDSSGYLNITRDGYLVIRDEKGTVITINSGEPATTHSNTSLTLLDSGNLVLKSGQRVVWQSFDHPTDTILPGMKIGLFDLKNSQRQPRKQFLTSWVGPGVPSAGAFTLGVNPNNTKQLEVQRRGTPYWHSANWDQRNHSYFPFEYYYHDQRVKFSYTSNENESYFSYSLIEDNYSWIEMNSTGNIRVFLGKPDSSSLGSAVACDVRNEYRSKGCIEVHQGSNCSSGDEFVAVFGDMDMWTIPGNKSVGLSDCEEECRKDCSCTAFASESPDGSGCMFSRGQRSYDWPFELMKSFYIRNATAQNDTRAGSDSPAPSPTPPLPKETPRKKHRQRVIIVGVVVSLGLLGLACSLYYIIRRKCLSKGKTESPQDQVGRDTQKFLTELGTSIASMDQSSSHNLMIKGNMDCELPLFSFSTIETATEHFSVANKLGQGGFGPVFKGKLVDGKEIAVKRLSERSSQGVEEFKNEVVLISKVQHRNLVRLYGCCVKGEEKILIYEYLPNKSLDTFLFDETKRLLLDWKLRMNIIEGIAQGLLYLHKYSRLKIIHRDLKTSNILLDNNMNPKISDFGTAKIFGENESRANTSRIVGTYGYMSPEYAMDGLFSVKSDVFSFGVMMLEIISGKKNMGFYQSNESLNLTRQAWNLWKEERSLELMDPTLAETCSTIEFQRCVQIALLCVQENAADRPAMSGVVSMLNSSDMGILPEPKHSSFTTLQIRDNLNDQPDSSGFSSVNGVTISTTYTQ